ETACLKDQNCGFVKGEGSENPDRCVLKRFAPFERPYPCREHHTAEACGKEPQCFWENLWKEEPEVPPLRFPPSFRSGLEELGLIDAESDLNNPPKMVHFGKCDVEHFSPSVVVPPPAPPPAGDGTGSTEGSSYKNADKGAEAAVSTDATAAAGGAEQTT
ncbi:unnamed protein product, partial [Amoebophrya sp. A120]